MPELSPPDKVESITYAQSTDEEKRVTHAPLGTILLPRDATGLPLLHTLLFPAHTTLSQEIKHLLQLDILI
jgi:hypothetical protein